MHAARSAVSRDVISEHDGRRAVDEGMAGLEMLKITTFEAP
jgi:hypothetical protein